MGIEINGMFISTKDSRKEETKEEICQDIAWWSSRCNAIINDQTMNTGDEKIGKGEWRMFGVAMTVGFDFILLAIVYLVKWENWNDIKGLEISK